MKLDDHISPHLGFSRRSAATAHVTTSQRCDRAACRRAARHAQRLLACALVSLAPLVCVSMSCLEASAGATVVTPTQTRPEAATPERGDSSLEAAAAKAGDTGRAVAMSLLGLAFAVAAIVLAFRRDFREAAGVFAVGIVCVLLATPEGISLLRDTVASVFGAQ